MNVEARASTPSFAARNKLDLDHAFGPKRDHDFAVRSLRRGWHEDPGALLQGCLDLGSPHDLRKVRRADLFFTFGDENEVHRELAVRTPDCVKRGDEGSLRPFLIYRASTHHDFPEGFVDQGSVPRRR